MAPRGFRRCLHRFPREARRPDDAALAVVEPAGASSGLPAEMGLRWSRPPRIPSHVGGNPTCPASSLLSSPLGEGSSWGANDGPVWRRLVKMAVKETTTRRQQDPLSHGPPRPIPDKRPLSAREGPRTAQIPAKLTEQRRTGRI